MSLFETLSDMSKQHAENSGSYKFENPVTELNMKTWEYVYNGNYFDVKTTDTPCSSISIFHNDGTPEDARPLSKEQAETACKLIVNALNGAEKTAKEINETL